MRIRNARPASSVSSLPQKKPKTTAWWEFLKTFGGTEGIQVSNIFDCVVCTVFME